MTEPDPKRGAQLLFERNERTYERFNALRGFPRERMNWIDWLWDLHCALAVALRVGDTQDAIEADLRADAAARVQDLLYWDARGSTPWATVPNANSARPDDARLLAHARMQTELTDRIHQSLEEIERAAAVVSSLLRAPPWLREAAPPPPPRARVGSEPHGWKEEPPLSSGRRCFTCLRCGTMLSPEPAEIAGALAASTCAGGIVGGNLEVLDVDELPNLRSLAQRLVQELEELEALNTDGLVAKRADRAADLARRLLRKLEGGG